jgi:signal transduction histidine kinase
MDDRLSAAAATPGAPASGWSAERRAISRELHDDIAHSVLTMLSALERLEPHQDNWAARRLITDAKQSASQTLEKVRELAARLRDPADPGHDAALCGDASADLSTELFFVLREAMHNALSHARARKVVVDVKHSPERITAVVEDDGEGFEPDGLAPQQRVGLLSMYERAALVGGRLHIDSTRNRGTRVILHVPCRGTSHGGR